MKTLRERAWRALTSCSTRKGKYTVYVSAGPIYRADSPVDEEAKAKAIKYNKTFAQIVAKALKETE
jgi:hypothetical protein